MRRKVFYVETQGRECPACGAGSPLVALAHGEDSEGTASSDGTTSPSSRNKFEILCSSCGAQWPGFAELRLVDERGRYYPVTHD